MKRKSVVPLNDPREAFNIFKDTLTPSIVDAKREKVDVDLGDFLHGILDHLEMPSRVGWIAETLQNPEEIRRHWDKALRHREIYVNTIYESAEAIEGETHVVVVDRRWGKRRFWTTFVPRNPETYSVRIKRGDLLWQAEKS